MLGFVRNMFGPRPSPIGVDFGSDTLRLAQTASVEGRTSLVAAARADVPSHVRGDLAARAAFFADALLELLPSAPFRGRQVRLNLPATGTAFQSIKLTRMDEASIAKALPWELQGKIPFDPANALIRHEIAGETFQNGSSRLEVLTMAARRDVVESLLDAAARAKMEVVGVEVEAVVTIDGLLRSSRRAGDLSAVTAYVDLGCTGTRVYIARGRQILFARSVAVGSETTEHAIAKRLEITVPMARSLRSEADSGRTIAVPASVDVETHVGGSCDSPAMLTAGLRAGGVDEQAGRHHAHTAVDPVNEMTDAHAARLAAEIGLCRKYVENTLASTRVERLVFIGGDAAKRSVWQPIARRLQLPALVGDTVARLDSAGPDHGGLDRRVPQPAWALAVGLAMFKTPAVVEAGH